MTNRYFQWSGVQAAGFLASLALAILPIHFFCEFISRRYEERTVLKVSFGVVQKVRHSMIGANFSGPTHLFYVFAVSHQRSLVVVVVGLIFMINYGSMFSLAQKAPKLLSNVEEALLQSATSTKQPYDWKFGVIQYVVGLTITFVGLISMDGAALSLLSKLAPLRLRSIVINVGTISVFLCFTARILGDAQILFVGVSHRLINTDMVNAGTFCCIGHCVHPTLLHDTHHLTIRRRSLLTNLLVVIPLLLVSFPILFLVRKHFFFLI